MQSRSNHINLHGVGQFFTAILSPTLSLLQLVGKRGGGGILPCFQGNQTDTPLRVLEMPIPVAASKVKAVPPWRTTPSTKAQRHWARLSGCSWENASSAFRSSLFTATGPGVFLLNMLWIKLGHFSTQKPLFELLFPNVPRICE